VRALLQTLTVLLPPLYLIGALLAGMSFAGERGPRVAGARRAVLSSLLVLHGAWFFVYAQRVRGFPIDDAASSISAVVFSACALHCLLARWTRHGGSGGIVLALLFVGQLAAACLADLRALPKPGTLAIEALMHVATSVVATAALILSGVHGLLYLVLLRQMRRHQFGVLFAGLPDLDVLARLMRGAALFGFLALTVGINVGIWLAHRDHAAGFEYRAAEVALSIVLWLHFGAIACSGWIRGFSARRAAWAAAIGLAVVMLSLALVLVPGTTFHSRL